MENNHRFLPRHMLLIITCYSIIAVVIAVLTPFTLLIIGGVLIIEGILFIFLTRGPYPIIQHGLEPRAVEKALCAEEEHRERKRREQPDSLEKDVRTYVLILAVLLLGIGFLLVVFSLLF